MIELKTYSNISEIGQERWNSLSKNQYPFLKYEFLNALEASGSVSARTGWQPMHIELVENDRTILLMPTYLKNHSYGEYVFDWAWADAYESRGLSYYPKLLSAIPYTPSVGPRWLSTLDTDRSWSLVVQGIAQLSTEQRIETWHLLFPTNQIVDQAEAHSTLSRHGIQYHWFNRDYASFDDFLATFTSRKRKELKKERARIAATGIKFRHLRGDQVSETELEQFYQFYAATYAKRGRAPYLNFEFFEAVFKELPQQILLVLAEKEGEPIAGALSFEDDETLYGRYWGCLDEYDGLHFETCYYQGIEHCISSGLKRFDPGAQGEHKIKRGFEPTITHSLHWIASAPYRNAIADFVKQESQAIQQYLPELRARLPFKQDD